MKAAFVIGASLGGADIGNTETVRRKTIEAYNTANVLSTDHDIEEWLKTFYFQNILYPFFFKRRDDPWGRIWSGYLALKDSDDHVFRTNTLHGKIPYVTLYNNNDNSVSDNEFIIPPGWLWTYIGNNRYTVSPFIGGNEHTVETADTSMTMPDKFVFANPFGIRVQKNPFAIGYFNPWINEYITVHRIGEIDMSTDARRDISAIYHATPLFAHITRTYMENYYKFETYIDPSIPAMHNGDPLVQHLRNSVVPLTLSDSIWKYFNRPLDAYAETVPMLTHTWHEGYIGFEPTKTYLCASTRSRMDTTTGKIRWVLTDVRIMDESDEENTVIIPIDTNMVNYIYGSDEVWGNNGLWEPVYQSGDTAITMDTLELDGVDVVVFDRVTSREYYTLTIKDQMIIKDANGNDHYVTITKITVSTAIASKTSKTKYGETTLWRFGTAYQNEVSINVTYEYYHNDNPSVTGSKSGTYIIRNAKQIYFPYTPGVEPIYENGMWIFEIPPEGSMEVIEPDMHLLYAEMHASPASDTVEYYRIPFDALDVDVAAMYMETSQFPVNKNNMRIVLQAYLNGSLSGWIEMQPVSLESDGAYLYEASMYPTNQLIDLDNRVHIASSERGGGNWQSVTPNASVSIDASTPELHVLIFIKSDDPLRTSDFIPNDSFTGYRLVDEYLRPLVRRRRSAYQLVLNVVRRAVQGVV